MSKILYVKDLYNKNGEFKTLQELSNDLKKKNNGCEYQMLKKIIKKKANVLIWSVLYKNTKRNVYNFHKGTFDIFDKRCKFYYVNLLQKKIQTTLLPICIKQIIYLILAEKNWKEIYESKVKNMYYKILSEFNIKL